MSTETEHDPVVNRRQRAFRWARIAVTIGAFGYIMRRVDPAEVLAAGRQLSASAFLLAFGFVALGFSLAIARWHALLRAYGAIDMPSWRRLGHLYLVGFFYNTYAPGGVGGDVVRGAAGREAFGDPSWASVTSGVAVVFIERVCGVAALLTIAATAYLRWPLPGVQDLGFWAGLGLLASVAAVLGVAIAPRMAPYLPPALGEPLRGLPRLHRIWPFTFALLLSFCIQGLNVAAGHAIMHSLSPEVSLSESAVAMPVIAASAFFPLTVGGAGVREAAFATLYGAAGVAEAVAYAGSLSYWALQLLLGALGGLLNLLVPLSGYQRQ